MSTTIAWLAVFPLLLQPKTYDIKPPVQTVLQDTYRSSTWTLTVPFEVVHKREIEKLISCESGNQNVSRPDSDGVISDGILQFHRSKANPNQLGSGTWEWMASLSGITGSPLSRDDAVKMTDWAIEHGLGHHWSCWALQGLNKPVIASGTKNVP